jgi:anthranilate phosphoribosyltransferase
MDTALLLNTLLDGKDLKAQQMQGFLEHVIAGEMTDAQIAAILTALRMKGESSSEIVGLLHAMRAKMIRIQAEGAIDIVGTGGDGSGTFNISTVAIFVAAGAGAKIAKHGNRAASSKCGSADVLEALGVNIQLTPEQAKHVLDTAGLVFLLAPIYHAALKQVVMVRKELRIRTVFNILGPFANPAGTKRQLIGVPNDAIAKKMAQAAKELGYTRALIVTSEDGMDEISLGAKTKAYEVKGKTLKSFMIDPKKFGFKAASTKSLQGGNAQENAAIIRGILQGDKGPKRDIVVVNAGFALYVADIAKTPKEGIKLAEESIDSGKAAAALERLVAEAQKFKTV